MPVIPAPTMAIFMACRRYSGSRDFDVQKQLAITQFAKKYEQASPCWIEGCERKLSILHEGGVCLMLKSFGFAVGCPALCWVQLQSKSQISSFKVL